MAENRIPTASVTDLFPGIDDGAQLIISSRFFNYPAQEMGVVHPYETLVMAAITRLINPDLILEFGTSQGRSTMLFASNAGNPANVHTLDLVKEARGDYTAATMHGDPDIGLVFKNTTAETKIRQFLRRPAEGIPEAMHPYSGQYNLLFVDAAHDYASVKSDTEAALSVAAEGAVLLWHDFYIHSAVASGVRDYLIDLYGEGGLALRHIAGTFLVTTGLNWTHEVPGEVMDADDPRVHYMPKMIYNADREI